LENTAVGRLHTGVLTVFSQYERESIVERSVDKSRDLASFCRETVKLAARKPGMAGGCGRHVSFITMNKY
jgi:hypothetical protein